MFGRVVAVLTIFFLVLAIACEVRPDYPSRSIQEEIVIENDGPKYTVVLAENDYGSESTLLIYEGPGFFWAEEDCDCRLDAKEKIAILKALHKNGVDVIGARVENGPSEGRSYKMFVYPGQNIAAEKKNEDDGGNITIIGGGVIVDLEGTNAEDIEVVENSENTEKEAK